MKSGGTLANWNQFVVLLLTSYAKTWYGRTMVLSISGTVILPAANQRNLIMMAIVRLIISFVRYAFLLVKRNTPHDMSFTWIMQLWCFLWVFCTGSYVILTVIFMVPQLLSWSLKYRNPQVEHSYITKFIIFPKRYRHYQYTREAFSRQI